MQGRLLAEDQLFPHHALSLFMASNTGAYIFLSHYLLFEMYLLYYLLGIYLLWNYMCYGVYVDIKRQLVGVSCLLPTCGN